MISAILNSIQRGFTVFRSNSKILLVGILVFVFPVLFFGVSQSFFTTSYDNINSIEKKRIATLHDTLAVLLEQTIGDEIMQTLISDTVIENSDITKLRVVQETEGGLLIKYAAEEAIVGTYEKLDSPYLNLNGSAKRAPVIHPLSDRNGDRVWQVFRIVENEKLGTLYIFSEHSYSIIDSIMASRRQHSYLGLTAIFIFLIALAYWVNSQTNWAKKHKIIESEIEERDNFTNMIAHEFRTPLTAIKGYASFLEESKTISKEEVRYVANIRVSTERLVLLVNDFLEVARIQSGKLNVEVSDVNVTETVKRVIEDLQPIALKKDIQLKFEDHYKQVVLKTDEKRLVQVLTNIVTNAIKYTKEGSVTIDCVQNIDHVVFRIKDTGMGISSQDQKKLFVPFTRVGNADDSSVVGPGLGMWITQHLVYILGVTIGIESIKDLGTHVVISFKSKIRH
jgi:signal transduction histidine kinase